MSKKKRQESALGLPTPPDLLPSSNGSLTALDSLVNGERSLSKDGKRVFEEWKTQQLVILGQESKTVFAQEKVEEIWIHAEVTFDEGVENIYAIKARGQGTEYQCLVDEFSNHAVRGLAQDLLNMSRAGAYNIAVEVNRSLYPPAETEKEKPEHISFWKLLFG